MTWKRAQLPALWIATIVATWFIVRGQTADRPQANTTEEVASTPARSARGATFAQPSLQKPRAVEVDRDDKEFQSALASLEHDMADGRWSEADRDRLNAHSMRLGGRQAFELYLVLFPKLNDGSIKSDIDGPPI